MNQNRFREYNERIEPHNAAHQWVDPPMPDWVCECANEQCTMPVRMTLAEYGAVRGDPTRFFVVPGDDHVVPEVERVIERHERFWVVEKLGEAADVSQELDARAHEVGSRGDANATDQNPWNVPVRTL